MKSNGNNSGIKKKKAWFEVLKGIMKIKYKKPKFIYLGEEISNSGIILSNHEVTDAPMSLEIYSHKPLRFWGAHEMNSGLISMYKYQTKIYYHEKKHWNLTLARLFCLIASPLTNLFYSGFDLISTYRDARFIKTVRESKEALNNGYNVVILPEVSEGGYNRTLKGFHEGFALFAHSCLKSGMDPKVFVSYYNKPNNTYVIDEGIPCSVLFERYPQREELASALCQRCNELGELSYNEEFIKSKA